MDRPRHLTIENQPLVADMYQKGLYHEEGRLYQLWRLGLRERDKVVQPWLNLGELSVVDGEQSARVRLVSYMVMPGSPPRFRSYYSLELKELAQGEKNHNEPVCMTWSPFPKWVYPFEDDPATLPLPHDTQET